MSRFSRQELETILRDGRTCRLLGQMGRTVRASRDNGSGAVKDKTEGALAVYVDAPRLSKVRYRQGAESLDYIVARLEERSPFSEIGLLVCSRIVRADQKMREASRPTKTDIARHLRLLQRHPGLLSSILVVGGIDAHLTIFGETEKTVGTLTEKRRMVEQLPPQPDSSQIETLGLAMAQLTCDRPSYIATPTRPGAVAYAELGVFYQS